MDPTQYRMNDRDLQAVALAAQARVMAEEGFAPAWMVYLASYTDIMLRALLDNDPELTTSLFPMHNHTLWHTGPTINTAKGAKSRLHYSALNPSDGRMLIVQFTMLDDANANDVWKQYLRT